MLSIQEPRDLIAISLHKVLSYRTDEKYYELVKDWNKKIVINVKEFYPVTVTFQGDTIGFEMGDVGKADLKVTMGVNDMLDIANGRLGAIKAALTRKIKIKGILKIGVLLKFMKIFLNSMKLAAQDPVIDYNEFENKRCTK